jgi:hypothetical protein
MMGSCSKPTTPAPAATEAAPAQASTGADDGVGPEPWEVEGRMQLHFAFAQAIVGHMVRGNVDEAQAAARELAEMNTPSDLPITWKAGFAKFRAGAATIASADTPFDVGVRTAAMGMKCAECHQSIRRPDIDEAKILNFEWGTQPELSPHEQAAYLMWTGVFLPSPEIYAAGVQRLEQGALSAPTLGLDGLPDGMGDQISDMAMRAASATSEVQRADAYGRYLVLCHECHEGVGASLD